MTERKFIDEDIIKALECCVNGTSEACLKCAFGLTPPYPVCKTMVEKYALDLINRQRAEIEKWQLAYDCADSALRELSVTRSEAIKEFAERVKKECLVDRGYEILQEGTIDHLVKEMTEGK